MDTAKLALWLVAQQLEDPAGHDERVQQAFATSDPQELVRVLGIVGAALLGGNAERAGCGPGRIVQEIAIKIDSMEANRDRAN